MIEAVGTNMLLAAASGPHLPGVSDFLPPEILFQGTPFAINRIIFIRIVATVLLLIILGLTASRAKLIPGRWQGLVELGMDFVRDNVVYETMGQLRGKRYVPMITTLFFTIFFFNLFGVIPGANMAATATVTMPLVFAIWVLAQYWIAATREKGLWNYIRDECFTPGVPWPVYILLAPIQLLELVIIRPASLTIRLFANMISGHLTVATCLAFAQFWMIESANKLVGVPVGAAWFLGGIMMTLFEIFVAFLQAYVFSILATVYINLSYPEAE
jgi:F-type H+-transporting ATPase subunit a